MRNKFFLRSKSLSDLCIFFSFAKYAEISNNDETFQIFFFRDFSHQEFLL